MAEDTQTPESLPAEPVKPGEGGKALYSADNKHLPVYPFASLNEEPTIIKYTFAAETPFQGKGSEAEGYEESVPFTKVQREAALAHMELISRGGNIKFVEAPPEEATMRFFQSRYVNEEYWKGEITGLPSGHVHNSGERTDPKMDVHISSRSYSGEDKDKLFQPGGRGSGTILHEIMHAIGADHPLGKGKQPGFGNVSIMSYLEQYNVLRLGDVEWLADTFGPSKREDAFTRKSLPGDPVILAKSATIDLSGKAQGGTDFIDLNERGYTASSIQIASEADVEIKTVKGNPNGELSFTGDKGSTTVEGGTGTDTFIPRGGVDTFAGGSNTDIIQLDVDAGRGHRVTDFTTQSQSDRSFPPGGFGSDSDTVMFGDGVERVTLQFTKTEKGVPVLELEVYGKDAKEPGASLRLEQVEIRSLSDITSIITPPESSKKEQFKIEGKTPSDQARLEALTATWMAEEFKVTGLPGNDKNGNPVVEVPLAPERDRELADIARAFNAALRIPEGEVLGEKAGASIATIKDAVSGKERPVLSITSGQFTQAWNKLLNEEELSDKRPDVQKAFEAIRQLQEADRKAADDRPITPEIAPEPEAMKLKPTASPAPKPNSRDSQPER